MISSITSSIGGGVRTGPGGGATSGRGGNGGGISSPPEPPSSIISIISIGDGNGVGIAIASNGSIFSNGIPPPPLGSPGKNGDGSLGVSGISVDCACTSGIDGGIKTGGDGGGGGVTATGGGDDTTTGGLGLVSIAAVILATALLGAEVSVAGGEGGGVGLTNGAGAVDFDLAPLVS